MDIQEFSSDLFSSAIRDSKENNNCIEIELAQKILDIMGECGEIASYEICQFKKKRTSLTAYSYNEDLESLDLFLFCKSQTPMGKVSADFVLDKYDELNSFYREAMRSTPFYGAEVSIEVKNAISVIKEVRERVKRLRLFFITNGIIESSPNLNYSETLDYENIIIEYGSWDISRIFRLNSLNIGNESIEIDFLLNFNRKIQCLRVEDNNPKIDAYFAIMPGDVLAHIYDQYKQTLLEGNVRLFLQKTNKVNRQICKTIKERPEMFFSFNNGISATAKHVEFGSGGSKTAPFITKITDLQIVNGGQTTATIAAMQECDLSKVFVPMKISVIKDLEEYSEIVKEIATSANSQSAIKRSDFLSGDEYLQMLEAFSKQEVEPRTKTKWYFERKRGQYRNELLGLIGYDNTLFTSTYPKNQILEKSEVARLAILWDMKPYLACKSKEVVTVTYFTALRNENALKIDSIFYRNIVSLHILYDAINNYVKNNFTPLFGTYTSRITYYVISSIAYLTERKYDLSYIWSHQEIQNGIIKAIKPLFPLIHKHLFEGDYHPNYLKESNCWEELKGKLDNMVYVKFAIEKICNENVTIDNGLSEEEMIIDKAISIPAPMWKAMAEWGKSTGKLSMAERMRLSNYAIRHRALEIFKNVKTAKSALELEEKARALGFSIDSFV